MDETTVTLGGVRHHAHVYRDRMSKTGDLCWVCAPVNEGSQAYGYGDTAHDAIQMYLKSRQHAYGIAPDAPTCFTHLPDAERGKA